MQIWRTFYMPQYAASQRIEQLTVNALAVGILHQTGGPAHPASGRSGDLRSAG